MYKKLLLPLLCLFTGILLAQPVITMQDLLQVGDVIITQPCSTGSFQPGPAGANQSWDFSQLALAGPLDTTFYIPPAGTPYAANYPSSNIVSRFGTDGYSYYQTSGNRLFFWGQSDPSSTLVLTDPAVYFQSPATYGTFVLDTIAGSISTGPLNGSLTGRVYLEGDGYGDLVTPGGQYSNVLRVKTVTVGLATVPFLGTITDSVFNYSWYQLGIKSPVLEMIDDTQWSSNGTVISQTRYVNYYHSLLVTPTSEPAGVAAPTIRAYPNPTPGELRFSGLEKPGRIVLRDMRGVVVLEEELSPNQFLDVKNLPAGVYIGTVSGDFATQVVRIVRGNTN